MDAPWPCGRGPSASGWGMSDPEASTTVQIVRARAHPGAARACRCPTPASLDETGTDVQGACACRMAIWIRQATPPWHPPRVTTHGEPAGFRESHSLLARTRPANVASIGAGVSYRSRTRRRQHGGPGAAKVADIQPAGIQRRFRRASSTAWSSRTPPRVASSSAAFRQASMPGRGSGQKL